MKIKTTPTLIAIFIFLIITIFFSSYEAPTDGLTEIGFPLPLYIYGGKIVIDEVPNLGFNALAFIIDLVTLTIFIFVGNYIKFYHIKKHTASPK